MKLCSACLLGIRCRYDGKNNLNKKVLKLARKEVLIPVCPEQLGGLPTPRTESGVLGNRVLNQQRKDVTKNFVRGAKEVLRIAKLYDVKEAIFKQGSPSCGNGLVFQWKKIRNKWTNCKRKGDGITTALLKRNGIKVISEENL
ncbi:MAG: DUF523 domain-containing protein [Candidatus Pacearchaeota archaeon]